MSAIGLAIAGLAVSSIAINQFKTKRFSIWPFIGLLSVIIAPILSIPILLFYISGQSIRRSTHARAPFQRQPPTTRTSLCAKCGASINANTNQCRSCGNGATVTKD